MRKARNLPLEDGGRCSRRSNPSTTTGEPRAGRPRPVRMRPDLFAGARCARTANLYRVKVKQPIQDQQQWSQVVDSAFNRMGQIRPIVRDMGHKGPNFSGASSPLLSELGKCVRHFRQRVGYTVETLASASGLPDEYIEAVEAGRVELSVRALVVICEALGLSGAILFRKNGDQDRGVITVITVVTVITPAPTLSSLAAEGPQRRSVQSSTARWTTAIPVPG